MSLEADNIVAGYDRHIDILHGVSMKAEKSRITCILGPNGCGKTTLLKTIYGFVRPKQGRVFVDGEETTGLSPYTLLKKGIAYVLQRRSVFPYLTIEENLKMGTWYIRKNSEARASAIEEIYNKFTILKEKKKVQAGTLSGGQQRLLEFARALVSNPKILLLDEPSAGLAPKVVKEVYNYMVDLAKEKIAILLVDQNVRLAVQISDYVYIMEQGQFKLGGEKGVIEKQLKELIKDWLLV